MLLPMVLIPNSISTNSIDCADQKLICSNGITLLRDLCEYGFIMDNKNSDIWNELCSTVISWPITFRKKVEELLFRLHNSGRITKYKELFNGSEKCTNNICKFCIGLAKASHPHTIVVNKDCSLCSREQIPESVEICDILEYPISKYSEYRDNPLIPIHLSDGEWNQNDFENKILIAIFKYAKSVKIIDRYIGKLWKNEQKSNSYNLSPNYRLALKWIIEAFINYCINKETAVFEIYTGFDCENESIEINEQKVAELRKFEVELKDIYKFNFKLHIKKEIHDRSKEMPHGRFIFTNQIGLLIERGFDLLWNNKKMKEKGKNPKKDPRPIRDVSISYCKDKAKIERDIRKLEDYK